MRISIFSQQTLRLLGLLLVLCPAALAQTSQASQTLPPPPPSSPGRAQDEKDTRMFASMEDEMRAKREIQAADKAHRDNVNRARNLASLGSAICESYKAKSQLTREDLKTLEKAEKLAKSLRESLGGSDDDIELEDPPADLAKAIEQISTLTASLKDKVEKTPKRVISTEVIDEANVLLQLIRLVRGMHPRT